MGQKAGMERTILITGANRGLGLEFTRQYLERGDLVFAGCRSPERAEALQALIDAHPERGFLAELDVTQDAAIDEAVRLVRGVSNRLDILVNNAGAFVPQEGGLRGASAGRMLQLYHLNAVAPVILTQRFLPLLKRAEAGRVAHLVSGAGVLRNRRGEPGRQYSYGATKAALNLLVRKMADDLHEDGILSLGIAPGFVLTDMTRNSPSPPPLLPEDSVRGMIRVIDAATLEQSGHFLAHDGTECDWFVGKD